MSNAISAFSFFLIKKINKIRWIIRRLGRLNWNLAFRICKGLSTFHQQCQKSFSSSGIASHRCCRCVMIASSGTGMMLLCLLYAVRSESRTHGCSLIPSCSSVKKQAEIVQFISCGLHSCFGVRGEGSGSPTASIHATCGTLQIVLAHTNIQAMVATAPKIR